MKKFKLLAIATMLSGTMILAACANSTPTTTATEAASDDFNAARQINVISREEGSGTRGAFIELLGIEVDGIDHTYAEADIANGTSVVVTTVAGNTYAIGYISLGSLNDTVTAVPINGVPATPETVQNGTYPVFRSFYLAARELSDIAQDFLNFVLSTEGQEIVASRGYIVVDSNAPAFSGSNPSGTVVVTGSTSVAPVMERLAEAYREINPDAIVEVHSSGSGAGITAAIDGTADIGMSSRDLRAEELASVDAVAMAHDGIAIIVNNDNPITSLTPEEVRQMFTGSITQWSDLF